MWPVPCSIRALSGGRTVLLQNGGLLCQSGYERTAPRRLCPPPGLRIVGTTVCFETFAAISPDGQFLYVLAGGRAIDVFRIDAGGNLQMIQSFSGIPGGSNGLVAR